MSRKAKRYIVVFSTVAASIAAGLTYGKVSREQARKALPPTFEFGRVTAGTMIENTFYVVNTTDKVDSISGTRSSCSCTAAFVEHVPIAPGATATIRVTVRTATRIGKVDETVTVNWRSGRTDFLRISGFVVGHELAKLEFGVVNRGDNSTTRRFALIAPGGGRLKSSRVEYDHNYLEVFRIDLDNGESPELFGVRLARNIPYGPFNLRVVVLTDDSLAPDKVIAVSGEVRFPLFAEPSMVTFGELEDNESKTATVRVYSPYGAELAIDRIELIAGTPIRSQIQVLDKSNADIQMTLSPDLSDKHPIVKSEVGIWAHVGGEEARSKVELHALRTPQPAVPK